MNRIEKTWQDMLEAENSFLSQFNCEISVEENEDGFFDIVLNGDEYYAENYFEDELVGVIRECTEYCRGQHQQRETYILVDQVLLNDAIWEYNTNVNHYSTADRAWNELKRRYKQELEYCKNEDHEVIKAEISEDEQFARIETPAYIMFLSVHTVLVDQ